MTSSIAHNEIHEMIAHVLSMQGVDGIEHTNAKCHMRTL